MNALPDPKPGRLWLLIFARLSSPGPASVFERLWDLIARLALRAPVRVLDAGNCFSAYAVAERLRRQSRQVEPLLERISVARAFTCYQAAALLDNTPTADTPTLVLELLSTFYDENVPLAERCLLLRHCTAELRRLAARAPVMLGVRVSPGPGVTGGSQAAGLIPDPDGSLLEILEAAADQVWWFEPAASSETLRLF